jgi:hypothetical protein
MDFFEHYTSVVSSKSESVRKRHIDGSFLGMVEGEINFLINSFVLPFGG